MLGERLGIGSGNRLRAFLGDGIDIGIVSEAVDPVLEQIDVASLERIGRREIVADQRTSHIVVERADQSGFGAGYSHIPPDIDALDIAELRSFRSIERQDLRLLAERRIVEFRQAADVDDIESFVIFGLEQFPELRDILEPSSLALQHVELAEDLVVFERLLL